jgi:DNA-binding PadR family transcriptional regulator
MADPTNLLQGTLDMLIFKAVSLGPLHGYGVLLRIQQVSRDRLEIQQGSLYPIGPEKSNAPVVVQSGLI